MSERMTVVRWLPPLPNMADGSKSLGEVRMQEWLVPTAAVAAIRHDSTVNTLLSLCNELEVHSVLSGAALWAAKEYLRHKARSYEAGRIVSTNIE